MYRIAFTESALDDLRFLAKSHRNVVLDNVQEQLASDPLKETRHRKPLRPNDLASWQLRVGDFRVFYDIGREEPEVVVKAVGWKEHNQLFIRGTEYRL